MAKPRTADVAVIGAGITGVAAAYFLAKRDVRVVLVEAGALAGRATARNAGLILTGLADHYNRVARGVGRAGAAAIWRATIENGRLIREAVRDYGIECGYEPCGSWALATFPAEAADLAESFALLREDGLAEGAALFDAGSLAAAAPGPAPRGLSAIRFERDAAFDAAAFARGLHGTLEPGRVETLAGVDVRALECGAGGARLETAAGEVRASIAVCAANAWAPRLHRFFEGRIWPVRGQGFVTAPLGRRVLAGGVTASWGHEYYRQRPDGRLVVAGVRPDPSADEIGTDEGVTGPFQGFLERFAAQRIAGLPGDLAIESRFASIAAFSQDGLPLVGPVPGVPSLVSACGYTMRGLSLGMFAGRAVAGLVADGTKEYPSAFAPGRFL